MHWRYEWIAALPADVYAELVAMLQEEAQHAASPDASSSFAADPLIDPS